MEGVRLPVGMVGGRGYVGRKGVIHIDRTRPCPRPVSTGFPRYDGSSVADWPSPQPSPTGEGVLSGPRSVSGKTVDEWVPGVPDVSSREGAA